VIQLQATNHVLNAICPYFTMFPLDFPLGILRQRASRRDRVLDPFCGRGTTNFAARLLGLKSWGIDSNPVAAAITSAKLVRISPKAIVLEAASLIESFRNIPIPEGEFWARAYHHEVLRAVCALRAGLQERRSSAARRALCAIVMGALHGPLQKTFPSYFSNQSPRTYAPKPAYAAKYWRRHKMRPPKVDVLDIIARRAEYYYSGDLPEESGDVTLGDSRNPSAFAARGRFRWVITSPPYYGLRTYLQDQWLRNWFLGGSDTVSYSTLGQLSHLSAEAFATQLRQVWVNATTACLDGAQLVIRFGGISDRNVDSRELLAHSLSGTDWRLTTINNAGHARLGKRQADAFLSSSPRPRMEHDFWARLD
jgi:hypothetical protein